MSEYKESIWTQQFIMACFWSFVAAGMLIYIVIRFGDRVEILTLIIGILGGTVIGGIFGVYFGSTMHKRNETVLPGNASIQMTAITPPKDIN